MSRVWTEGRGTEVVRGRSGGLCEICGVRPGESFSHRLAAGKGGTWRPSNGLRTCGDGTRLCHGWLEAHPIWAGEGGWHVRRNPVDPALQPAYLRPALAWPGWWLVTDADPGIYVAVDPADYGLPEVPEHLPYVPPGGRPLATVPWVDPR